MLYDDGGTISYVPLINVASSVISRAVKEFKSSSVALSVILADIVYEVPAGTVILYEYKLRVADVLPVSNLNIYLELSAYKYSFHKNKAERLPFDSLSLASCKVVKSSPALSTSNSEAGAINFKVGDASPFHLSVDVSSVLI